MPIRTKVNVTIPKLLGNGSTIGSNSLLSILPSGCSSWAELGIVFKKISDSSETNKELLMAMPNGAARPSWKTKLGQALARYIMPNGDCYDAKFDKAIRKKQPQWWLDSVLENKRQLLAMPKGIKRPLPPPEGPKLGRALADYVSPASKTYDPEFKKAIQKKHPQWWSVLENKRQILAMPKGAERPIRGTKLGNALRPGRDPEFDKAIRKKQPQWWFGRSYKNKRRLLAMPKEAKRPNSKTRLGCTLLCYTLASCYDPEFDKAIRKKQPQWWFDSAAKNKRQLLNMPKGAERPIRGTRLGNALANYTWPSSNSHDPEFDNEIRTKQPRWFTVVQRVGS